MGFLLKRINQHGGGASGGGTTPTPKIVTAAVAISTSNARNSTGTSAGITQSVSPSVATSSTIAKTPTANTVAGQQIVNTSPAATLATAIAPNIGRSVIGTVAISNSTAKVPQVNRIITAPVAIITSTGLGPTISGTSPGAGFMGTNAAPIEKEDPDLYTSDSLWRARMSPSLIPAANIFPSKDGTGSPGFYNNTINPDLADIVAGAGPSGGRVIRCTYYGDNGGGSTRNPQLQHYFDSALAWPERMWVAREVCYPFGFTSIGDADSNTVLPGYSLSAVAFNNTQSNGYKTGSFAFPAYGDGRMGTLQEYTDIDVEGGVKSRANNVLYGQVALYIGQLGTAWTDHLWYVEYDLLEFYYNSSNLPYAVITKWRRKYTDPIGAAVRVGPKTAAPMTGWSPPVGAQPTGSPNGRQKFTGLTWFSENMNKSFKTLQYRDLGKCGWWDANDRNSDGSSDPWGLLTLDAAHTPTPLASNTFVNTVGAIATCKVKLTLAYPNRDASYVRYIRPLIDGVEDPTQDFLVPYETAETGTSYTSSPVDLGEDANVLSVPVTFPTGSHTISFRGLNLNKSVKTISTSTVSVSR